MSMRHSFTLAVIAAAVAAPAPAGPISVAFEATNVLADPANPAGSRFEGGAADRSGKTLLTEAGFKGGWFNWLAVMRFQDEADLQARGATAVEQIAEQPFALTAVFTDDAGRTAEAKFSGRVSGQLSMTDPRLDVALDNPIQSILLGETAIDVALEAQQFGGVTPAVTFDGGLDIPTPLPFVTELAAAITVTPLMTAGPEPTDEPEPTVEPEPTEPEGPAGPVSAPAETPEPATLALAVVGVAGLTLRRRGR